MQKRDCADVKMSGEPPGTLKVWMMKPRAGSGSTAPQKERNSAPYPNASTLTCQCPEERGLLGWLNINNNTSVLSFFNFLLDGEDFEDLEGRQATGWRGPGSLNDCMEQCSLSSTDLLWTYDMSNKPTLLELKA